MVHEHLRQRDIEEREQWWQDAENCCSKSCDCDIDDKHSERLYMLMGKVGERENNFGFANCRQVRDEVT